MFIRKHTAGGYRGTERVSGRGDYLILFSWNDYKAADEVRAECPDCQTLKRTRDQAIDRWNDDPVNHATDHAAFNWLAACDRHAGIRTAAGEPRYSNGRPVLWAAVRSCSLHQCGQFMMGRVRIGSRTLIVSGPCGADGLPKDYQDVPPAVRHKLVEVPEAIAAAYWADTGHNDIGSVRDVLRDWALTLPRR